MIPAMEVSGLDDTLATLNQMVPRHARNLLRATVHGIAGEITKEAKKNVPRTTGNLKKSIKTKRKKSPPDAPVSQVVFEDAGFYWRFIEHGTGGKNPQPARPFLLPARELIFSNIDRIAAEQFSRKLEAAIKRELKKRAKKGR